MEGHRYGPLLPTRHDDDDDDSRVVTEIESYIHYSLKFCPRTFYRGPHFLNTGNATGCSKISPRWRHRLFGRLTINDVSYAIIGTHWSLVRDEFLEPPDLGDSSKSLSDR